MIVFYKCRRCCTDYQKASCPSRKKGQDILNWMEIDVRPSVSKAHRSLSPFCNCKEVDLALPVDKSGEKPIGADIDGPIPPPPTEGWKPL